MCYTLYTDINTHWIFDNYTLWKSKGIKNTLCCLICILCWDGKHTCLVLFYTDGWWSSEWVQSPKCLTECSMIQDQQLIVTLVQVQQQLLHPFQEQILSGDSALVSIISLRLLPVFPDNLWTVNCQQQVLLWECSNNFSLYYISEGSVSPISVFLLLIFSRCVQEYQGQKDCQCSPTWSRWPVPTALQDHREGSQEWDSCSSRPALPAWLWQPFKRRTF